MRGQLHRQSDQVVSRSNLSWKRVWIQPRESPCGECQSVDTKLVVPKLSRWKQKNNCLPLTPHQFRSRPSSPSGIMNRPSALAADRPLQANSLRVMPGDGSNASKRPYAIRQLAENIRKPLFLCGEISARNRRAGPKKPFPANRSGPHDGGGSPGRLRRPCPDAGSIAASCFQACYHQGICAILSGVPPISARLTVVRKLA